MGTGHFMRCLTLANALKLHGADCRFISRYLPEHLQDMLRIEGHAFAQLRASSTDSFSEELSHSRWLGVSQSTDAADSVFALADQYWDWLVVDNYALDAYWESHLRKVSKQILVIDDIADRVHDCDMLLDQNFSFDMETRYSGKLPLHCRRLLGPRYALLRHEFRQWRESTRARTGPVKRILVFFGGVDADNFTGRAVSALSDLDLQNVHVDVVIGAKHPARHEIEVACSTHRFHLHVQTDRMAELMATADLAIGAGGTATWERCCVGLPTLAICTANNQLKQVEDAAIEGLLYAPAIQGNITSGISRHVSALLENDSLRESLSRRSMQAVDALGTHRVLNRMGGDEVEMRLATSEDAERLFVWRNHPSIRAVSRNAAAIKWDTHVTWLTSRLSSAHSILLIGERAQLPIGVVHFEIRHDDVEISIYLVPDLKEPGLGGTLLQSAERWLAKNRPEIRKVRAHVLGGNKASQHLFLRDGFEVESLSYLKILS
jgi:UDP-2,4-diacetamido-2,4,6-trideoxy-beta-L-altropyranose hydrolase